MQEKLTIDETCNNNTAMAQKLLKVKVFLKGFQLGDIKVETIKKAVNVYQLRINATHKEIDNTNSTEKVNEFSKIYDLPKHANVNYSAFKYFYDADNNCLIVAFESDTNTNLCINLNDDTCQTIVEKTFETINNNKFASVEEIKSSIDQYLSESKNIHNIGLLQDHFLNNDSLLNDVNSIENSPNSQMKIIEKEDGSKILRVEINIPPSICSVTMSKGDLSEKSDNDEINRLNINCDGLNLHLNAESKVNERTSIYTKRIKLPKGTQVETLKHTMDKLRHSLIIEATYID